MAIATLRIFFLCLFVIKRQKQAQYIHYIFSCVFTTPVTVYLLPLLACIYYPCYHVFTTSVSVYLLPLLSCIHYLCYHVFTTSVSVYLLHLLPCVYYLCYRVFTTPVTMYLLSVLACIYCLCYHVFTTSVSVYLLPLLPCIYYLCYRIRFQYLSSIQNFYLFPFTRIPIPVKEWTKRRRKSEVQAKRPRSSHVCNLTHRQQKVATYPRTRCVSTEKHQTSLYRPWDRMSEIG